MKEQKEAISLYLIQKLLANTIFPRITGASTTKQVVDWSCNDNRDDFYVRLGIIHTFWRGHMHINW